MDKSNVTIFDVVKINKQNLPQNKQIQCTAQKNVHPSSPNTGDKNS